MLLSVARGLAQRGHEINLISCEEEGLFPAYRAVCKSCLRWRYPVFGLRRLPLLAFEAVLFGMRLRGIRVERLVAADVSQYGCFGAIAAASRIPLALHLGVNVEGFVRRMVWVGRVARAGVAPSAKTAQTWATAGWPKRRLHVVPNWVEDAGHGASAIERTGARAHLSLNDADQVILYLGRIIPEKGIGTLLKAWAGLAARGASAILVLVGTAPGWFGEAIDSMVKSLPMPRSRLLTPGPTDEPSVWIRAANLLVLPSEAEESFGLTPLEAILEGTLPIVSSAGFLPEIVGPENADLVFPKGDAEALARLLARWLPDSAEKRARTRALQERVAEKFNPDRGVDAYERILLDACSRPRAPRHSAV